MRRDLGCWVELVLFLVVISICIALAPYRDEYRKNLIREAIREEATR